MSTPSEVPITRQALSQMSDRVSFLYVERAVVNRDGNALTITDQRGVAHVPATKLAVLILGPGTRITYAAMALLGDAGAATVWAGQRGVRYYAHGRPPAKSSRMAEIHAEIVTNQRKRLDCARKMYSLRFPGEDVSALTMAQLRGREGARMKKIYAAEAKRTGIAWSRREYDPNDFDSATPINQALTTASAALYGIAHAVVVGLGFIPALGIVHSGTDRAFVYDIADLYKAEIAIPAAFSAVAAAPDNPIPLVRRLLRDAVVDKRLMQRMVHDLKSVMSVPDEEPFSDAELYLWSELEVVSAGMNWSEYEEAQPQ
ncbi:type I-E CRISPR-associated endonuclease Cas1e [Corynebacterium pseudodiphtheriticum]|uniref:type I-E CRISPR-associated endonuclease Cas1e n=1 Tax=Corynebacterium pseudodiphtheriticum TaxID=37637 RepID=UPI0024BED868|nr:type I-E CRISPR-associated endonuclease Cas1e [Corynebacterium pseudodiphtheriticum]MDK8500618.1 type I-E CRISPR-associated endonuclease Cas1e [Corynebacterium pseudodiphtheriticum]MDK8546110.1 type I-E CRISPR-associated endonuclease Cas1e [Corynebacterium pseudodiphtheriticum]MDK8552427.1 type I-E CRISPR-associated endonuclease Cas1e [Corynebacterium pseudodiphtheriticum]MDK8583658.1 type I-E CRISPR-associated endonuclease Cas1e [Corynebacterium pseudodiphtheriticum]MDK8839672.1 type I-E C